jgi:hypothetical protein
MRFIAWNLAVSAWLLISAFALPHSPGSAALTGLIAVLNGTFAVAAPGLPGLRLVNGLLAIALAIASLLMPDVGLLAQANGVLVAAIVLALASVPGRSTVPTTSDGGAAPQP